ncbi:enediyne biosynthesis protein UnbU [Limnofasciculus baicalensis]|uniref:RnfABCDGE type electron transport complex subunit D n=1 Tax=Limnofasciculus baicalensis BBK-W-15 TaxID=2699891 RepID=A0AAE3KP53_9CYAN|nr:RnfABCDGE type electron transport complex subunit D [Limnofasciculus baicalensis BBK-W-15]
MIPNNNWYKTNRLAGLRRFAIAITILNLLGHTILGFEQSWAQPLIAIFTAYTTELILEIIDAKLNQRPQQFAGGIQNIIDFLLPAHITALAVAMLLYANDQLLPIAFATSVAIGSKAIFRVPVGKGNRHFLNPSNFGITFTLLLFPWVGIAPPYQFTENLDGAADWILPGIIVISGTFLNAKFTQRLPLIAAWVGGFIIQALLRSFIFGTPIIAGLIPITSVAFVLFTFYMVTDPGTTPIKPKDQIIFGSAVAIGYGILMLSHIVFGFFFSLTAVCLLRGLVLSAPTLITKLASGRGQISIPITLGEV